MRLFTPGQSKRLNEVTGFLFLAAGILFLLSMASFHPRDPSWDTAAGAVRTNNLIGPAGAHIADVFLQTLISMRFTIITISALMAIGFLARYSGMDATLGLAFARTGAFYPFFGTLIGWLGTASTGSDTSSNVLFGSLQKLTAQQLGISPYLMTSANSTGGVMGKMIAPQSIVVATTATNQYGSEGTILRFVFLHSLALACLMGLLVSDRKSVV